MVFSRPLALPALALIFSAVNFASLSVQAAVDVKQCPKIITGLYKMNGDEGVRELKLATEKGKLVLSITPDKFIVDGLPQSSAQHGTYVATCENDTVKITMQAGKIVARYYDYDNRGNFNLTIRQIQNPDLKPASDRERMANEVQVLDVQLMSVAAAPSKAHDPKECADYPGPYVYEDGEEKGDRTGVSSSRIGGELVLTFGSMGSFIFDGKAHPYADGSYVGRCQDGSAALRILTKNGTFKEMYNLGRPNSNKSVLFSRLKPFDKISFTKTFMIEGE